MALKAFEFLEKCVILEKCITLFDEVNPNWENWIYRKNYHFASES